MLRTTTLSEIIKESPTSCCSLMSRRCAAQDRCDAASGWVDFCAITIKRPRESPRHVGRGECCAWPSMPSYILFVTIADGKLMSRGGCRRPAPARSPPRFCHRFYFLTLRQMGIWSQNPLQPHRSVRAGVMTVSTRSAAAWVPDEAPAAPSVT